MKKLMVTVIAATALANSAFAMAELTDDNTKALTEALTQQGYSVEEITVVDDNYNVIASKDDQTYVLTISDAFEVLDSQPMES